ncbi:MAG: IS1595 family transposase, partial [Janthinobacterium sp.]
MLSAEWTIFIAQFASLSARQRQDGIALLRGNAPQQATIALIEDVARQR